ncbi:MAG: hypothetical protein AAB594_01495 [Patescibacteria group bacterium]
MAKKTLFLVAIVAFLTQPANAGILKQFAGLVENSLSAVKVDSPALKKLGFDLNGNHLSVISSVPFYGRVYVYDKEVALISPGESIDGVIGQEILGLKWEPLNPQVSVLIKYYLNADDLSQGKHLGFASKIFSFQSQSPRSESWIVRLQDIKTADGNQLRSGQTPVYALTKASQRTHKVDYPREDWNATAIVQVANNTHFDLSIRVGGQLRYTLSPGEIYIFHGREVLERGQQASLQFTFASQGYIMGTAERQFRIPGKGVHAYQFVLSPRDIRQ